VNQPTVQQSGELSPEAKALTKRLGSRKAQERQQAEQQVQEMGAAGRDLLISIMRHEEQRQRAKRRNLVWKLLFKIALLGVPTLFLFVVHGQLFMLNLMLGNIFGFLLGSTIVALITSRSQHNAACLLATHFDDVSIIGPMAEALEYRSRPAREAATAALLRLLPRLQEDSADLLTVEQRGNLHRALMGKNPRLVLAVLNTVQQIGDSKAMPNVQKLAAGLGIAGEDIGIQEAAQHTLLLLRQRIDARHAPATLLRASSVEAAGTEDLLRPATAGAADTQSALLLRAVSNATEETH
jgi:hypothetical protein